jgi:phosphoenolpyruvate carboxykinase (GTP)
MLPFCGYNFGDYFQHWLNIGEREGAQLPRMFYVNWFRKNADGKFMWPGFGENLRVLKWVLQRVAGEGDAIDTPIGAIPTADALDVEGLGLDADTVAQLLAVNTDEWIEELQLIKQHYTDLGERLPQEMLDQLAALETRLAAV